MEQMTCGDEKQKDTQTTSSNPQHPVQNRHLDSTSPDHIGYFSASYASGPNRIAWLTLLCHYLIGT